MVLESNADESKVRVYVCVCWLYAHTHFSMLIDGNVCIHRIWIKNASFVSSIWLVDIEVIFILE